jgi:hypothetical protein
VVLHQVAHRPARQPEQAQQAVEHRRPLGQQGEVAVAAQQRLDPVEKAHHGHIAHAAHVAPVAQIAAAFQRPRHQARQARTARVGQQCHAR